MQARGPLMIEHRLIERMIGLIRDKLGHAEQEHKIDPMFVDAVVDFIKTYADRTHHGKEEDILFRDLAKKDLSDADETMMNELIEEHRFSRETTMALAEANSRYKNGDAAALEDITARLSTLADVYPRHIEKEDKKFFPASRSYLSEEEDQAMLAEFRKFDQQMIHEKYGSVVDELSDDT